MTSFAVPRYYPHPMAWDRMARNGKVVDHHLPLHVAKRGNFALTHCRKLLFHKTVSPKAAPQSIGATQTPWRWMCRTGENNEAGSTIIVFARAAVLPATTDGVSRWRLDVGGNYSAYREFPSAVSSPDYNDLTYQTAFVATLAPDTEYECAVEIEDQGRLMSLDVFEVVGELAETGGTHVITPFGYFDGAWITDSQHAEFAQTDMYEIWKHNAAQCFTLVPDVIADAWTRTTASYANMLVAAHSTTPSANTAGINVQALYHNSAETDDVACVFAAFAVNATAPGGDIKLEDSGGTLGTLSTFGTTAEWKSVAVNLDGSSDLHKVDVQIQGDGSNELTVYAVSLFEYLA